eukprot:592711-Amorphochlora_amoeboformis.AAC.2
MNQSEISHNVDSLHPASSPRPVPPEKKTLERFITIMEPPPAKIAPVKTLRTKPCICSAQGACWWV